MVWFRKLFSTLWLMYSYSRTAAKKDKPSARSDGAKPNEVEAAIKAVEKAIDAVHDCAPNGRDFRTDEDYDSKSYQKEVEAHSDRIHALNNIREELYELLPETSKASKKKASYDRRASKLHLGPARRDDKATTSIQSMKLQARNKGDLQSALVSAAFHAKRTNKTMYVYAGNSYMSQVWRVDDKPSNYLSPINNTGTKVLSVTPDLTISWHDLLGRDDFSDREAASTTMKSKMWYYQNAGGYTLWFLAQKEQKNGGFAGKLVRWTSRTPKAINDSVPKSFWSLWKELPESEVPNEVKDAV